MIEFALHPNVYATGEAHGLLQMLERVWVRDHKPGDGTIYVISGFGNYNGGVRFFDTFRAHVGGGGRVVSLFAGSTSQRLTSKQLVTGMLESGASVRIVNRKRLLHSKFYGAATAAGQSLVVTSGNFTGPGMGLNVESSVILDPTSLGNMAFSWETVIRSIEQQTWDIYEPSLDQQDGPAWRLLYDEYDQELRLDESEEATLLLTLGRADTARIQASPGTMAGRGSQYFWLSRDCFGFFPPLTERNARGQKATFSCLITLKYVDLEFVDRECRVTFEAENNLDFRLGTGRLRYTRVADQGDLAAISRVGEREYELRIIRQGSSEYRALELFLVTYIGHQGKKYGYVDNAAFSEFVAQTVGRARVRPN
jgi:hypothetical protein